MITAYALSDPAGHGVRINIVDHGAAQTEILRIVGDENRVHHYSWQPLAPTADIDPTLVVPDDIARALYEALAARYRETQDTQVEDVSALRKDYDDERDRVNRLLGALARIAEHGTGAPVSPSGQRATYL